MVKTLYFLVGSALVIFLSLNVLLIKTAFDGNNKPAAINIAEITAPEITEDPFLQFADDQSDLASTLNNIAPAAGAESIDEGFGDYFLQSNPAGFTDIIEAENTNEIESDEFDL